MAGALFVLHGQVFPVYLHLTGGLNRFGVAFGLAWLLVTWFAALGHVLLFGSHINATRLRRRQRQEVAAVLPVEPMPRSDATSPAGRRVA